METFMDLIKSEKPVLVDFYADWCGPCKAMDPVIKEVAKAVAEKVRVVKINIDKQTKTAQHYQITGVPTYIMFKNGEVMWRHSGMIDKSKLLNVLNSNSK